MATGTSEIHFETYIKRLLGELGGEYRVVSSAEYDSELYAIPSESRVLKERIKERIKK